MYKTCSFYVIVFFLLMQSLSIVGYGRSIIISSSVDDQRFQEWLIGKIQEKSKKKQEQRQAKVSEVAAKVEQRAITKEPTPTSISTNSTSIVDKTAAADLIGFSVTPKGTSTSTNNMTLPTSATATISAYALYSAIAARDPLEPGFYNQKGSYRARSFSLILGVDDNDRKTKQNKMEVVRHATIAGFKVLLIDKRQAIKNIDLLNSSLFNPLVDASEAVGKVDTLIQDLLFVSDFSISKFDKLAEDVFPTTNMSLEQKAVLLTELMRLKQELMEKNKAIKENRLTISSEMKNLFGVKTNPKLLTLKGEFANKYLNNTDFTKDVLSQINTEKNLSALIDRVIDDRLEPIAKLAEALTDVIEDIRTKPQLSFQFLTKTRDKGSNDYSGELIFGYGIRKRLDLTINASFEYRDRKKIGADSRGGKIGANLKFQTQPDKLSGASPITFDVSAEGKFMSAMAPIYKVQTTITLPIPKIEGVSIPISFTFANRTELIKERTITGQFGFSFDVAKIVSSFNGNSK